jgi:hypothetical protein
MSGVYLIVWDEGQKDRSPLLKPTKGGWPHITVAYTGEFLPLPDLVKTAQLCFGSWSLKEVVLQQAYVNSFEEKQSGSMRHDVLLKLSDADTQAIETTRDPYLRVFGNAEKFAMRTPHVTHSIHSTLEEAQAVVCSLNLDHLPYRVNVTGVTVD